VDVVRFYWRGLHTWQVSYRASPNGTWLLAQAVAIPELVEEDDQSDGAGAVTIDPAEAHAIAREAWDAAWDHLDTLDVRRCDYKLGIYRLDDNGDLILAGETGQGGRLTPNENTVEDAPTEEEGTAGVGGLVPMLIKERKDMVAEVVRMTRALASVGEKMADVLEKGGDLIQKAGDGDARKAEADADARREEAKWQTLAQVGLGYIEKQAPVWKAKAEKKMRDEGEAADATLEQLCRFAASSVDGPTAIRWGAGGFDWQAVVSVLHKAGEHPDWENRVKTVMLQLEGKTDLWKVASATCTHAFARVASKLGISLG
jgi:hypothetical protein